MSELTREQIGHDPLEEEPEPPRVLPGWAVVTLLVLNAVLLAVFGLMFTPLYAGGIPVPMGALLSCLVLPWLVARAGEIDARPAVAGAPLVAWVVTIGVLVLFGPGGDQLLLLRDWPPLLLVVALFAGLWALRGAVERGDRDNDG